MDKEQNTPESVQPRVESPDHGYETILSWCLEDAAVKAARSLKDTKAIAPDYVCHLVKVEGTNNKRGLDKRDESSGKDKDTNALKKSLMVYLISNSLPFPRL